MVTQALPIFAKLSTRIWEVPRRARRNLGKLSRSARGNRYPHNCRPMGAAGEEEYGKYRFSRFHDCVFWLGHHRTQQAKLTSEHVAQAADLLFGDTPAPPVSRVRQSAFEAPAFAPVVTIFGTVDVALKPPGHVKMVSNPIR